VIFAVLTERVVGPWRSRTVGVPADGDLRLATGVSMAIMLSARPESRRDQRARQVGFAAFSPAGFSHRRRRSITALQSKSGGALVLKTPLHAGGVALLPLTGHSADQVPKSAKQAVERSRKPGDIVARVCAGDFSRAAVDRLSSRPRSLACPA